MTIKGRKPRQAQESRGFTLVELLVVLGVMSLLTSLLMPSIGRARDRAKMVQCAANLRQVGTTLAWYAAEHRGRMPPNVYFPAPGQFWYEAALLTGRSHVASLSCPSDPGGVRSYSMNAWASSRLDSWVFGQNPPAGRLWGTTHGSDVILVIESWSRTGNNNDGWAAAAIVGYQGIAPGPRFGGAGGLPPVTAGRWGVVNCDLDYGRHAGSRTRPAGITAAAAAVGAVNIAYADGHVALKASEELYDPKTGRSTLDSRWSPLDLDQNR